MKKIMLKIEGMTCSGCSNGLEKYLNKQEGIESAVVNLVMANALIVYDEKKLNRKQLEKFVDEAGFKSAGLYLDENDEQKSKNEKKLFIIFGILAIFLLYISMGGMVGVPVPNIINMRFESY